MMRDLHNIHRRRRVLHAHPHQRLRLNIGCEEYFVRATRQRRDNRSIVQPVPLVSATSSLLPLRPFGRIQDFEPALADRHDILALTCNMLAQFPPR